MSNTAFGVAQTSAGVGTTDTDMRKIIAAQWESTGVIDGLEVTGTTSLYYRVAAGVAVCSKGASDGKTLAYFSGGNTSTVSANSSGNPRIDCVWITAHDATQGDSDNLVTLGVTQGTAAATPTAPTIPTYATLLAAMLVPAGATTTANAYRAKKPSAATPYMLSTVQSDGTHVWYGTDVFNGSPNGCGYVYLWSGQGAAAHFPGFKGIPFVLAMNGDWNAQMFTVSGVALQGDAAIVFGVPASGLFRINWLLVGDYDPSLVS